MIYLRQLSPSDGRDAYNLFQDIGAEENAFTNPANGMSFEDFKKWLVLQNKWSMNEALPTGFVRQTIYYLVVDNTLVALGKIRHQLTKESRIKGGNIGYAVSNRYRRRGFGTIILGLLLKKADELGINEKLLTVEKYNLSSKRVIEKNGGRLIGENEKRWFFSF